MSQFRRIYVHIGPHKTGSSAIQLMCDDRRSILTRNGILYPQGRWHGQLGSYFSRNKLLYIYNRHAGNIDTATIIRSDEIYLTNLNRELRYSTCDTLVLSYEGFIDLQYNDLIALRDFLLSYADSIMIIAYCRHPLSFAPSEISQRCRMGVASGRDDPRNAPIPKFRDYFEKFEQVFGRENLLLSDFAKELLYEHDVRLDFLVKLGLSELQLAEFRLDDSRTNESLSAEAILLAEAMVKRLPAGFRNNVFFMRYNNLLDSIKGRPLTLSKSEEDLLMSASQPHLDYLKSAFDLTLKAPTINSENSTATTFGQEALDSVAKFFMENDQIMQAYRWLLGRPPESDDVIFRHLRATGGDWRKLRAHIVRSPEFRAGFSSSATIQPADLAAVTKNMDPQGGKNMIAVSDITICMIVLNEEEMLSQCLHPLREIFSAFVILDMRSTDDTLKIVNHLLGTKAKIIDYDQEWLLEKGYSAARNACTAHAQTDWVLMVDADEVLSSSIEPDGVRIDSPVDGIRLVSIKLRNLPKLGASLPEGEAPPEWHVRLYRNDGSVHWTGYIHEELAPIPGHDRTKAAESSLVFDHLSAFRDTTRDSKKRNMYRWMLLRAYENPSIRGGTNAWWYDEFVPKNIEMIRKSAREFSNQKGGVGGDSRMSANAVRTTICEASTNQVREDVSLAVATAHDPKYKHDKIQLETNKSNETDKNEIAAHEDHVKNNTSMNVAGATDKTSTSRDVVPQQMITVADSQEKVDADEFVNMLYRGVLRRPPDEIGRATYTRLLRSGRSGLDLLRMFVNCSEYRANKLIAVERDKGAPRFVHLGSPSMSVECHASAAQLSELSNRISKAWTALGVKHPHHSVLTAQEFLPENLNAATLERFWAGGVGEAERFKLMLQRHGLSETSSATCVEYGCGVGRVTLALAKMFRTVHAYDISATHIEIAKEEAARVRLSNLIFHQVADSSQENLSPCDVFYSHIVFQHNPPPIIARLIAMSLQALRPEGIAIFQVPTYSPNYNFGIDQYLARPAHEGMEMHFIPQPEVFALVANSDCAVLEVREDGSIGRIGQCISNTFIVKKLRKDQKL
jgi:SAM-dependent methyltransferase/glycosyltransferase involved in cell wall biosynthesis